MWSAPCSAWQLTPTRHQRSQFFLPTCQSTLDAPTVNAKPSFRPEPVPKSGAAQRGILLFRRVKEFHHFRAQLVCPSRAASLGNQSQEAALLEDFLCLVKRRPGETEIGGSFGDAGALHQNLAQHFVFHLHQIVGIKELVRPEQLMANFLRSRIKAPMLTQRLLLARSSALCHRSSFWCVSIIMPLPERVKAFC